MYFKMQFIHVMQRKPIEYKVHMNTETQFANIRQSVEMSLGRNNTALWMMTHIFGTFDKRVHNSTLLYRGLVGWLPNPKPLCFWGKSIC